MGLTADRAPFARSTLDASSFEQVKWIEPFHMVGVQRMFKGVLHAKSTMATVAHRCHHRFAPRGATIKTVDRPINGFEINIRN